MPARKSQPFLAVTRPRIRSEHDGVELAGLATDDPVRCFLRQGAVVDAALGLDSRPVREDDAAGVDPIRRLGKQVERSEPLGQVVEFSLRFAIGRSHEPVERGTLRLGAVFTIGCGDMSISRRGRVQFQVFSDQEERSDDRLARLLASGNENEPPIGYASISACSVVGSTPVSVAIMLSQSFISSPSSTKEKRSPHVCRTSALGASLCVIPVYACVDCEVKSGLCTGMGGSLRSASPFFVLGGIPHRTRNARLQRLEELFRGRVIGTYRRG